MGHINYVPTAKPDTRERERRIIGRHLRQVAFQASDENEGMIAKATSNQSFVMTEDEECRGEGLADADVLA